jgi:hypothetical protein
MLNGLCQCYSTRVGYFRFFVCLKIPRLSHLKFRNLNRLANIIPLNYGEALGFPYYSSNIIFRTYTGTVIETRLCNPFRSYKNPRSRGAGLVEKHYYNIISVLTSKQYDACEDGGVLN